jgi:hypothetical protein
MGVLMELAASAANSYRERADMAEVTGWLVEIGECDPVIREHVLERCRTDPAARAYFLRRARGEQ